MKVTCIYDHIYIIIRRLNFLPSFLLDLLKEALSPSYTATNERIA